MHTLNSSVFDICDLAPENQGMSMFERTDQ